MTQHSPYSQLILINSTTEPFHTIIMDFILALPLAGRDHLNMLLTVTDKFSKWVLLLPGLNTHSAKDWAMKLLLELHYSDWELPKAIISDRDTKFISKLWKLLFTALGVKMLTSTAYHPQTDELSERTNQSVEIALCFWCTTNPDNF